MIGAIIGDIAGSRFEFDNYKAKDFEIFAEKSYVTDDSAMTIAVAKALDKCDGDYSKLSEVAEKYLRKVARKYKKLGYGEMFNDWVWGYIEGPYNSFGNGAGMRISPVAYVAKDLEEVKQLSRAVTALTHNHPEGLKGAEAIAAATFLALQGKTKEEIRDYITSNYYKIDFTLDEIRPTYKFNGSCQGCVPQALEAFFESTSFEDAIRNAISIGGDSDTIGAMTGAVAEAYYGVPEEIRKKAMKYLDNYMSLAVKEFESKFGKKISTGEGQ